VWRTRLYAEPPVAVHCFGPQVYYVAPRDTATFDALDVYLAYRRPAWSRLATPPADVLAAVRFEPRDPVREEAFTLQPMYWVNSSSDDDDDDDDAEAEPERRTDAP
jgi:hypothetical protein